MDFLRDVKARLEELEQMAKEMENQQNPGPGSKAKNFQPKQQPGKAEKAGQAKGNQQKKGQPQKKGQQQRQKQQENVRSSRQPVDAAECPVEEWVERHPTAQQKLPEGNFILNNLHEYVGEAFLIQEILGPPKCMREFD